MILLNKHHQWFDRIDTQPRFAFFMLACALPFVLSSNLLFSRFEYVAIFARVVFILECFYALTRVLYMHSDPTFGSRTRNRFRALLKGGK